MPYSLRYFFTEEDENASQDYVLQVPVGEERRQVFAGYPPRDVITRSAIMQCFGDEQNKRISRMWTNIRCFDIIILSSKSCRFVRQLFYFIGNFSFPIK